MTKEDLDKVYDPTGENVTVYFSAVTASKYGKLLAVPCLDKTNEYARYYLASAHSAWDMRLVNEYGGMNRKSAQQGIRPVVSLKPTVKTTGTDMAGRWSIEIAE